MRRAAPYNPSPIGSIVSRTDASDQPPGDLHVSDILFHLIPGAPKPVAPYSHVVEADGWLFVTGQLATDPDDDSLPLPDGIEAQTLKVMDNLKRALEGVGAGFDRVVFTRIFLTDFPRDFAAMNDIYKSYFDPAALPGRTTVGVTHLARGGIVEIDMIARR
jgi:reactive intermediate/imine deaminase